MLLFMTVDMNDNILVFSNGKVNIFVDYMTYIKKKHIVRLRFFIFF